MYFLQNISYLSGNPVFLCCFRTGTVRKLRIEEYGEAERAGGTPLVDGWSRISFWRWSMTWWTFYTNIKMYVYDFASRWTPATKDDTQKRVLKQIDCIQFPKNSCSSICIVFFSGAGGSFLALWTNTDQCFVLCSWLLPSLKLTYNHLTRYFPGW